MAALTDPMLCAAAEALRGHPDHLRWLEYADAEMARLRLICGLPIPSGYSQGVPNYEVPSSGRAKELRSYAEQRAGRCFSAVDREAVERALDMAAEGDAA